MFSYGGHMGVARGTGRFLLWTAKGLVGWHTITTGAHAIRQNWQGLHLRPCPECARTNGGVLRRDSVQVDGETVEFIGCNYCSYHELLDGNAIAADEKANALQTHRLRSRLFLLGSFTLLLASLCILTIGLPVLGTSAVASLNTLAFSALLFAHGLRHSYRHWQVASNTFFVDGAFMRWVKQGNWIV